MTKTNTKAIGSWHLSLQRNRLTSKQAWRGGSFHFHTLLKTSISQQFEQIPMEGFLLRLFPYILVCLFSCWYICLSVSFFIYLFIYFFITGFKESEGSK